jgi:lipoprotein-releasing system permease protein
MSKLPFELLLALRYLRPRRTFVSVITVISILGVMLGVAVLIIVISVMTGFDRQLRDRILGFNAHLRVVQDKPLRNYREVMERIRSVPEVKGVAPYVAGRVLVVTRPDGANSRVEAPFIRGIDPALESQVSILPSSLVAGEFDVRRKGILVGRELADPRVLDLKVGDHLAIYSVRDFEEWQESRKRGQEEARLAADYTVNGIFDVGYYEYNYQFIGCSLANAQDMYALEDDVHGLIVMLHDPDRAVAVRQQLLQKLGAGYQIRTWHEENSVFLSALLVEKNMMFYLLFFIVLVAAFGITSALITFVVQKTREIGMLKALGATRGQVVWIFLSQSLVVGVLGVICGYGLGMLAVSYRNEFLHFMRRATSFELFPSAIYGFSDLPALIVPGDIAIICGGSLGICLLAGLIPAWNAGRLKPVEALRHE